MKSKTMIKKLHVVYATLFLMMFSVAGFSQACPGNQVTVTLANFTENGAHTELEFDVFVTDTGANSLKFAAMQGGIVHNVGFLPAGATGTFTVVQQPSAANPALFSTINNLGTVTYTSALRHMRWAHPPTPLASTVDIPKNVAVKFARFKFTSSLPFTSNFAGVLTLRDVTTGGYTNIQTTVYCNGNGTSTALTVPTSTEILGGPYNFPLNEPDDVCFDSGAASNLGAVTCFGGNNGSATITMSPVPTSLSATYTVDGGASVPVTLTAGGAFNVSGLTVGSHTIAVTGSGGLCAAVTVNVPVTISGPTSQPSNTTTQTACDSFTWSVTNQTYTSSGTYTGTSTDGNGCTVDEILNLTINSSTSSTTTETACDTFTWAANNVTYTESGTYVVNGTNENGCPDTQTLVLTINNSTSSTTTQTACDSYTWAANNVTYTESGTYVVNGTNENGCPDTQTLVLTINNSTSSTTTQTACDSYTWAANNVTYTESGTYVVNGTNENGCSDVQTLVLTINNSTSSSMSATACDTYTWAANGTTYTTSGTYTNVTTNENGCPDTATLVLTINNSTSSTLNITSSTPYTWAANGQTYATSGTYTFVSTNAAGCTFTQTLNLIIATGPTTEINPTQCGSTLPTINTKIVAGLVPGATSYRFRVTDLTTSNQQVYVSILRTFYLTNLPNYAFNTTYAVEVAVLIGGVWQAYGSPCNVTTPVAITQVQASQCGSTLTAMNQSILADNVPYAAGYRFRITDSSSTVTIADRPTRLLVLTAISGFTPAAGATYSIEVAVKNTDGTYMPYGAACNITTPGVSNPSRGDVNAISFNAVAYPNPFADSFMLDVKAATDQNIQVRVYDMLGKLVEDRNVEVDSINAIEVGSRFPSGVYNVIVSQGNEIKTLRVIKR